MKVKKTVFLTGATGLLGSYLLEILLKNDHKVYALARSNNSKSAKERVRGILRFWDKNIPENNLSVIEGDIAYPDFGIKAKDTLKKIIPDIDIIFHSAALAQLRVPIDKIRQINVEGTRNLLDFALRCKENGSLKKVNHISTAYVVGKKSDINFSEDMLELGQGFNNTYEQSKYEAEVLAKEYLKKGLNISIFRPSMVMGDTQEGKINDFRLFYEPIHFFSQEIYEEFPADLSSRQNLINIDTVAKTIFLLGARKKPEVYHITSPKDTRVGFFTDLVSSYFGFKMPKFTPSESFNLQNLTPVQRTLAEPYIPYFNFHTKFVSEKTQRVLGEYKFRFPKIDGKNLRKIFSYCNKKGFVKRSKKVGILANNTF